MKQRRVIALVGALATLFSLVALRALPAVADPTGAWSITAGPGIVNPTDTIYATRTSDGLQSAASMKYRYDLGISGGVPTTSWDFTTTSLGTTAEYIRVPYTWQGLHAWAGVTARLDMIQEDAGGVMRVVDTLYAPPSQSCCTSPSNGFITGGVAEFPTDDLPLGRRYGFRLSGSNGDYNSFLSGTFTLSTKPYLEALGDDNRQWNGAEELGPDGVDSTLGASNEARWWTIPVVPGEQVTVDLSNLPKDYDLALYGDIGAAFESLQNETDLTKLAAGASATTAGNGTQVPEYDTRVTDIPTGPLDASTTTQFAPRVYAPRVYAPRVYAPRVYAPRVYAPRVYAPRVYAGDAYDPAVESSNGFRDAFAAAQNQTLLAVSSRTGTGNETVSATTGNTSGFFYVRVQGHDDLAFDPVQAFHLSRTIDSKGACNGLLGYSGSAVPAATRSDAESVILTDSSRLGLTEGPDKQAYLDKLGQLAGATHGAVVDLATAGRVQDLRSQAEGKPDCPFAMNLSAAAIRDIVAKYRNPALRYVVIAGGDEVVPFFRYPDVSGLGQEAQFEPPLRPNTAAGASLLADQVLSQDAYGSSTDLVIGGSSVPVPDLAVGRLVKTPQEIESSIDHYLTLQGGTLPTPTSSLVTGYDFLADAAHRVQQQFAGALNGSTKAETLISEYGTPHAQSWHDTDLRGALLTRRHDLLFLAGHFSANDTLAADFETTFDADELAQAPDGAPVTDPTDPTRPLLQDSIVLSPGCHSGYQIVDGAAVLNSNGDLVTNPFDWTQRMAQQHAVLIGGTGYQYGDSDFLDYSERLYLGVAKQLRTGTSGTPVAVGEALVKAKQDYLATLATMTGIDQKAVLEATLYGLPMTGLDAPGRLAPDTSVTRAAPTAVTSGPGEQLGLHTDDLGVDTGINSLDDASTKPAGAGAPLPDLTWFNGTDGVVSLPGAPVLPKQVVDVSSPGTVLRGVGFRSGEYVEKGDLLPLTGAPAIEGTTPHTTFYSPAFFPQRMTNVNYFDALGTRGSGGRTSLVLTPAQWRSDDGFTEDSNDTTGTVRAYSHLGVRLFYSANTQTYGSNQPALAAPPSVTDVTGVGDDTTGQVAFSVTATGDPSAGVQQVWVTWTAGPGTSGRGEWASKDLRQDPLDSTHWIGNLSLPAGVHRSDVRFLVQAANGVGAVGLDTNDGEGYQVGEGTVLDPGHLAGLQAAADTHHLTASIGAVAGGAALSGAPVRFTVTQLGVPLTQTTVDTDGNGLATYPGLPTGVTLAAGEVVVTADLMSGTTALDSQSATVTVSPDVLTPSVTEMVAAMGANFGTLKVGLADASGQALTGVPITFSVPAGRASFTGTGSATTRTLTITGSTVTMPTLKAGDLGGSFPLTISAPNATTRTVTLGATYLMGDFISPVGTSTSAKTGSNVPVKIPLLNRNRSRIDDASAGALASDGRVTLTVSPTPTGFRPLVLTYDPTKDFFATDLKTTTALGFKKGTYTVTVTVRGPATTSMVLGTKTFTLKLS